MRHPVEWGKRTTPVMAAPAERRRWVVSRARRHQALDFAHDEAGHPGISTARGTAAATSPAAVSGYRAVLWQAAEAMRVEQGALGQSEQSDTWRSTPRRRILRGHAPPRNDYSGY